jgi:hypothetical protein
MKILAGELSFGCPNMDEHNKIARLIKSMILERGTKFEIVCGPEVWIDEDTKRNELFFLLDEKDERIQLNFEIYIVPQRAPVHYIIADNDVIIESSHIPGSLRGRKNFWVKNSIFWRRRLLKDFSRMKRQAHRIFEGNSYTQLRTAKELEQGFTKEQRTETEIENS